MVRREDFSIFSTTRLHWFTHIGGPASFLFGASFGTFASRCRRQRLEDGNPPPLTPPTRPDPRSPTPPLTLLLAKTKILLERVEECFWRRRGFATGRALPRGTRIPFRLGWKSHALA